MIINFVEGKEPDFQCNLFMKNTAFNIFKKNMIIFQKKI